MSNEIKLTIGMAHHSDYDGLYFTVQMLKQYHPEVLKHVQLLVVDNSPSSEHGKMVKTLIENKSPGFAETEYIAFPETQGTSQTRNLIFEKASGKYVVCMDCHVYLPSGAFSTLIQYYEDTDTDDLLTGPLVYDNLEDISTHFDPTWRSGMWGTWANAYKDENDNVFHIKLKGDMYRFENMITGEEYHDPVSTDENFLQSLKNMGISKVSKNDQLEFEIPAQGLGFFSSKRDTWLGFNKNFRFFGGEECYIHEKYRMNNRKTYYLPFLQWGHRFGRPDGVPYKNTNYNKCRNYVIGHLELGLELDEVFNHFVRIPEHPQEVANQLIVDFSVQHSKLKDLSLEQMKTLLRSYKLSESNWQFLLTDPINNVNASEEYVDLLYENTLKDQSNDIATHYDTIRSNAFGKTIDISRRPKSIIPLLKSDSGEIHRYGYSGGSLNLDSSKLNKSFKDVTNLDYKSALDKIEQCDTLIIQPEHNCDNFQEDLFRVQEKVSSVIIIKESNELQRPNVTTAIKELVKSHEWYVTAYVQDNWGCTVIKRSKPDKYIRAWAQGPGTELKKLLSKIGIKATPNCKCNARAIEMDTRGIEWCEENIDQIMEWLKEESHNRNLPFVKIAAMTIVKLSIKRAKKERDIYY